MPAHALATGAELHVPGYIQATDPGAVGAGKLWICTAGGAGRWVVYIRDADNLAWELAGVGSYSDLADVPATFAPAAHDLTSHSDWPAGLDTTELGYLNGVTSAVQTQLDGKEADLGNPDVDGKVLASTAAGVRSWIAAPAGGVTDHGALDGLADDDHTQYHTDARGDTRYYTKTNLQTSGQAQVHWGNVASVSGERELVIRNPEVATFKLFTAPRALTITGLAWLVEGSTPAVTAQLVTYPGGVATDTQVSDNTMNSDSSVALNVSVAQGAAVGLKISGASGCTNLCLRISYTEG